jgi:hypothetical protein
LTLIIAHSGWATIILAVGTRDGLLVCEDRRLTIRSSTGQVSFADANKARQLGKFGFFAITGDVSAAYTNIVGRSNTVFDLLSEIPAFFNSHDIQLFDQQTALEFEARLRGQMSLGPANPARSSSGPRVQTEIWLYWIDEPGLTHLYVVNISDALVNPAANSGEAAAPAGHFVLLDSFKTSKPLVRGSGQLGYDAVSRGTFEGFIDLRQDEELKPFLNAFVDSATVDSIAAARSIKKLIREISDRQNAIRPGGLDVGPASDCFLGTADGIKNIDQ